MKKFNKHTFRNKGKDLDDGVNDLQLVHSGNQQSQEAQLRCVANLDRAGHCGAVDMAPSFPQQESLQAGTTVISHTMEEHTSTHHKLRLWMLRHTGHLHPVTRSCMSGVSALVKVRRKAKGIVVPRIGHGHFTKERIDFVVILRSPMCDGHFLRGSQNCKNHGIEWGEWN